MATTTELLQELHKHLDEVQDEPSTPLSQDLLDRCKIFLPMSLDRQGLDQLIAAVVPVLLTLQQDPTPACQLLQRLVEGYSYSEILALAPALDLALGLDLAAQPYHKLTLSILEKAAGSVSSAAQIALEPRILHGLVSLMLVTESIGDAEKAREVLVRLLRVDQVAHDSSGAPTPSGGQGMVWKRVFGDHDVYKLLFSITSWKSDEFDLGKGRKTTAQIRLLQLVEDLAWMDWHAVSCSHHDSIEIEFGSTNGDHHDSSLLDYAALHMISWADDDPLVLWNLIYFLSGIASSGADLPAAGLAPQLKFLLASGLHQQTMALYMSDDQLPFPGTSALTNKYLYGPAASYIATYTSVYPTHFLQSEDLPRIQNHLHTCLDRTASAWAHGESPSHDLSLLASLPRTMLLPRPGQAWSGCLLSLLPSSQRNADLLNTLTWIFRGDTQRPSKASNHANAEDNETLLGLRNLSVYPGDATQDSSQASSVESAAARMAYFLYSKQNPNLWMDIVAHAEVIALKDVAVAALQVINALVQSSWQTSTPSMRQSRPDLLADDDFKKMMESSGADPRSTGLEALLDEPAVSVVVPYLISPPKTFSNVLQSRGGSETQTAAYEVAAAKMDTVRALESQLRKSDLKERDPRLERLSAALATRIREGTMGGTTGVGREIATMEI